MSLGNAHAYTFGGVEINARAVDGCFESLGVHIDSRLLKAIAKGSGIVRDLLILGCKCVWDAGNVGIEMLLAKCKRMMSGIDGIVRQVCRRELTNV